MIERKPWVDTIDDRAMEHLQEFVKQQGLDRFLVVADQNTWKAQGEEVVRVLQGTGAEVNTLVFTSDEVVADANHVYQVLNALGEGEQTLVSVGSGTITDITRYVANRTRQEFISIPTAPSVDAYVSVGAPMIVGGVKITFNMQAPIAVFADVNTLVKSPRPMIAAGLGDSLAKYTSVADFRLAHLIRDEIFDDEIARRMLATGQSASANVDAIAEGSAEGVTALLQALYDSGWCMVDFNNSRPASGTEHHYSHFWEMKLLSEGRHAILHGAKTGVGTILAARLWEQVRKLSRDEAADLLEAATMPDRDEEIATILRIYGDGADEVIATQRPFLDMTPQQFDALKRKILDNWDVIQQIAADVPAPDQVAAWLAQAGGPTTVAQLGLSDHEQYLAEHYSHCLRDRFTVRKLTRVLGLF